MSVGGGGYHTGMSLGMTPHAGPADVLAEVVARVAELDSLLWSARSDGELVAVVEQVQQAKAVLAAVEAGAVAEADARDLAKTEAALCLDR